jgi:hypothetical protein
VNISASQQLGKDSEEVLDSQTQQRLQAISSFCLNKTTPCTLVVTGNNGRPLTVFPKGVITAPICKLMAAHHFEFKDPKIQDRVEQKLTDLMPRKLSRVGFEDEDEEDITGATEQNLPAAINSTTQPLNTNMRESVNKILVKEAPEGKGSKSLKNQRKWEMRKKKDKKDKKDKEELYENANLVNFLKAFSTKNYATANKYLEEVINSKLKCRIAQASKETLFK